MKGRSPLADLSRLFRQQATSTLELELAEMERLFALLVLGSVTGLPAVPSAIGVELLPLMRDEIAGMLAREDGLDDMLVTLAGRFMG